MHTNDRRTTRATLAGIILALVPLFAFAGNLPDCGSERMPSEQRGMMPPPMGMQPPPPLDRLDMSESQQKQVDEIMQARMKLIIEKQRQVRKTVLALHESSDSESFDAAKTKSQADSHGKAVGELAYLHAETQAKVAAVLTPAQREQLRGQMQPPGCPGEKH